MRLMVLAALAEVFRHIALLLIVQAANPAGLAKAHPALSLVFDHHLVLRKDGRNAANRGVNLLKAEWAGRNLDFIAQEQRLLLL